MVHPCLIWLDQILTAAGGDRRDRGWANRQTRAWGNETTICVSSRRQRTVELGGRSQIQLVARLNRKLVIIPFLRVSVAS